MSTDLLDSSKEISFLMKMFSSRGFHKELTMSGTLLIKDKSNKIAAYFSNFSDGIKKQYKELGILPQREVW